MYSPINKQKAYMIDGEHQISNVVGLNGLWLPSQVQLTNKDIKRICLSIESFYRR